MMAGMDIQTFTSFGWLLTAGIVVVVFFLLCRQAVLWYFRINQIADDLHIIAQHYRANAPVLQQQSVAPNQKRYSGIGSAPAPLR